MPKQPRFNSMSGRTTYSGGSTSGSSASQSISGQNSDEELPAGYNWERVTGSGAEASLVRAEVPRGSMGEVWNAGNPHGGHTDASLYYHATDGEVYRSTDKDHLY